MTKIENQDFNTLVENFFKVNNKITQIQKIPLSFPNGIKLSTNALHLIEVIGKHPDSNITELAQILGVTKGAVSQQIPRLEKQGLIKKKKFDSNKKEILLSLTKEGDEIFVFHDNMHLKLYKDIQKDLEKLTSIDLDLINLILEKIVAASINTKKNIEITEKENEN
ncbi:MarR family transcriptional regulator [Lactococcus lactis]|uniref:MarR family winged helix-turn-helix transcriptional regulator n=1 Tax=Lactococcus lactis TaxID=1358 RepID=UPI0021A4DF6F|nr:MarR family transcriptional regulator [Lactococcus lactis]MCT2920242.1 MarR family transcriptional regulator [Lactococcus lactis]